MSPAQLRNEWERVHSKPAPRLGSDLLRLGIAYRLQEAVFGGLDRKTKALLRTPTASAACKPGTRFVRTWNGRTIMVTAEAGGYRFEDRRYGSLTAIAKEVTGTNWSGPRFFGLTKTAGAAHG